MIEKYKLLKDLPDLKSGAVFEFINGGVQGNKYKRTEPEFYAFNYITSNRGRVKTYDAFNVCEHYLNIPFWDYTALSKTREISILSIRLVLHF